MDDSQFLTSITTVDRTITVDSVPGSDVFNATDDVEFDALTAADKDAWVQLCQVADIDVTSGIAKSLEASVFGNGTTTRTNLLALKNPPASRAEELGLPTPTLSDIGRT